MPISSFLLSLGICNAGHKTALIHRDYQKVFELTHTNAYRIQIPAESIQIWPWTTTTSPSSARSGVLSMLKSQHTFRQHQRLAKNKQKCTVISLTASIFSWKRQKPSTMPGTGQESKTITQSRAELEGLRLQRCSCFKWNLEQDAPIRQY